MTRACSVSDSLGAANCRSRTFLFQSVSGPKGWRKVGRARGETLILPTISFLTGVNAIEPNTSIQISGARPMVV